MNDDKLKKLQEPFMEQDIEWRVQQSGITKGKPWAMVIPYITNRAIQKRLDEVFTVLGWENTYEQTRPTITTKKKVDRTVYGWKCGITIFDGVRSITKWDGAEETDIEPLKGGMSNSMKRAAVQFGIGRYLYQLESVFAICVVVNSRRDCNDDYPNFDSVKDKDSNQWTSFAWGNPPLPAWALPGTDFKDFIEPIKKTETLIDLRKAFEVAYKQAESSGDRDNTNHAIEAKDKRKGEILQALETEKQANLKSVTDWLQKQIDALLVVPNESAVTAYYETTNEVLTNKLEAFKLDPKPLKELFKEEYKKRIEALKPKPKQEKRS